MHFYHKPINRLQTRKSKPKVLVAAIDFGSTYSGYAFSFLHEFQRDPLEIHANTWNAGKDTLLSLKTPTVLLLKPDMTFHSFGYEAEAMYAGLAEREDENWKDWRYFERFKMLLYEEQVKCYILWHRVIIEMLT